MLLKEQNNFQSMNVSKHSGILTLEISIPCIYYENQSRGSLTKGREAGREMIVNGQYA